MPFVSLYDLLFNTTIFLLPMFAVIFDKYRADITPVLLEDIQFVILLSTTSRLPSRFKLLLELSFMLIIAYLFPFPLLTLLFLTIRVASSDIDRMLAFAAE